MDKPRIQLTDESLLKFGRQQTRHLRNIVLGRCAITTSGLVEFALNWLEKTDYPGATSVEILGSDAEARHTDLGAALTSADIEFDHDYDGFTIKRSEEDDSPTLFFDVDRT